MSSISVPDAGSARGYVVCATQRSGSNYLCQLLSSTGVLGRPTDFFNPVGRRQKGWHDYPDDTGAQLELVLSHGSTPNGVYGFKAFPEHLDALARAGWTERLPDLRWVYLRRTDLLAQAISLVIAKQTGRWRSGAVAQDAPAYDEAAIRAAVAELASDHARWRAYFASSGVRPLELTYEQLAADPNACAGAIASLMEPGEPVAVDASLVEVAVQRDAVNDAWRARLLNAATMREPVAAPLPRAPRLTVSIIARNAETRLPRLLAEASHYADQIVVGVDASSTDRTLEAAAAGADVVYRFALEKPSQLAPARLLPFDYATGDWILSLDDDESMEETFDALVPELMRAPDVTHYYLPRKWIVNDDPWEYVDAPPWFPNWSPRLFRNDRTLAWKPPRAHSMFHLQGPGYYDSRTSILHFEPLWCTPDERARKVASYRAAGASELSEQYYAVAPHLPRRPVTPRAADVVSRSRCALVHDDVRELVAAERPPWGCVITEVDMPAFARAGERVLVRATVRNTGALAWAQTYAMYPARSWPELRLSCRISDANGNPAGEGDRMLLRRFVPPGETITFIDELTAPAVYGDYVLEWDMLSENDCWFSHCGSPVYHSSFSVRP